MDAVLPPCVKDGFYTNGDPVDSAWEGQGATGALTTAACDALGHNTDLRDNRLIGTVPAGSTG